MVHNYILLCIKYSNRTWVWGMFILEHSLLRKLVLLIEEWKEYNVCTVDFKIQTWKSMGGNIFLFCMTEFLIVRSPLSGVLDVSW